MVMLVRFTYKGQNTARLVDAYNALIEITKESPIGGSGMPKERQYLNQYLDESVKIRKRILEGSLRSLEKAYVIYQM